MLTMEHRAFPATGEQISLLGFGTMRLPRIDPEKQDIDAQLGQQLIDYAYAHGVNYFDTAWPYHEGMSETFVGQALAKYPRESYFLADKLPVFGGQLKNVPEAQKVFEEQLRKCRTDYFDFYLCHSVMGGEEFDRYYIETGILDYLLAQQKAGRIRKLGFSFHGSPKGLEAMLNKRDWDFVQIQLNYLDWSYQRACDLYGMLDARGIPCIIMEPVRGGALVSLCEESVALLKAARPQQSTASWAIRFAASLPGVLTVLSGMSTLEQVEDNVGTMTGFEPLTPADRQVLQQALDAYLQKGTIPCTGCRYCMDCPVGIDIPKVFAVFNRCAAEGNLPITLEEQEGPEFLAKAKAFLEAYDQLPVSGQAHNCVSCKHCTQVNHCPQHIKIHSRMKDIATIAALLRDAVEA